ncbi:OmpA family protein [Pseudomonas sp. MH9.2]|nr:MULTISPECIES: OmpA family protein [unclassified Pseudomonas]MEB0024713.1 OmpA family protein [Pseudomonas sp. MH9.2]MEB0146389.1 OmpA family protein [Pseudomonas sp. CCC2.2]MEE3504774.1 OmpA family protein [Pseudomonas sp. 10C3]WPX70729.1 OmpA family protein [Pseudomonas sp. MH9.2]
MSSNKSVAFALCLAITGCAQTPQNDSAEGGHWWSFGADKVAQSGPDKTAAPKAAVPIAPKPEVAVVKPDAKPAPVVARADSDSHWWWPFGAKKDEVKASPAVAAIPMPDPKITQAWLDDYEPRLRLAIKDSPFELERHENVLVITAPADSSFNPKRPIMLLPVSLGPITRLAKIVESDPKTAVLVLGHSDSIGADPDNQKLTQDRAQSVAAIFRLSGLERDRLNLRGMGALMPRAANDSNEGRSLNRRVEIVMTPRVTMLALLSKYNMPAPAPILVAAKPVMPVAPDVKAATPAKKAVLAKKGTKKASTTKKAAPAKKAAPTKVAPTKAAAPAKKVEPVPDQAKSN